MDSTYDYNLYARLLLTVVTAAYGIGLIVVDLNKTHVTNPLWTPHARFHMAWQTGSYTGFAVIAWLLIWMRGPLYVERLYLVAGFAAVILASFFVALATMRFYDGSNYDVNAHIPKTVSIAGRPFKLDTNTVVFTVVIVLLAAGVASISR